MSLLSDLLHIIDDLIITGTVANAGNIKSSASHTYRVDGVAYQFNVDQTITYTECAAQPMNDLGTLRLGVNRNFIVFGEGEEIVRYAQTNKMSLVVGE